MKVNLVFLFNIWFLPPADLNEAEGHVASVGGEARDHFTARGEEWTPPQGGGG